MSFSTTLSTSVFAVAVAVLAAAAPARAAEQIHWTIAGPAAVSFDWVGAETTIEYGLTPALGTVAEAVAPVPSPWDMAGPFREARLTGLLPDTLYYWRIGSDSVHTFRTARAPGRSDFVVYAQGDIGSTLNFWRMGVVQQQIADGSPALVLGLGDITYANNKGPEAIRTHFNDVMVWSRDAAYMPTWGNHEWDGGIYADDLRNYKGRFDLPNPHNSPGVPEASCCGEDWYWFDYGNVRFIAYPDLFVGAFDDWRVHAESLMAEAQANPNLAFIVTYGHRPAYSSGRHPGSPSLKGHLDDLGAAYSKYRLNLNGHSHSYERTYPQSGVTHITAGGGGSHLSEEDGPCLWRGGCPAPSWSAFRALRHGPVRIEFWADQIKVAAICGPPGGDPSNINDIECEVGTVFDSTLIRVTTPDGVIDAPSGDVTIALGESVDFAATGTDPDGHFPLTYLWDFDGGAANVNVEDPGPVTFTTPGVYRVRMTVVESQGFSDPTPALRTITVGNPNQPPNAEIIEPAADLTITAGQSIVFIGTGVDPEGQEPLAFHWDFEGGATKSEEQNPGWVLFEHAGVFEVSLTVADPAGLRDPTPAFRTVTVNPTNPPPLGTNLVLNPSAETSLAGWAGHQGAAIERVAGGYDGDWAIRVRGPDSLGTFGVQDSPNWVNAVPGSRVGIPYRFQVWARSDSHAVPVRLQVREFHHGVRVGATQQSPLVTLTPAWRLLELDHAPQREGSTLDFHVLANPSLPHQSFVIDQVSIRSAETTGIEELWGGAAFAAAAVPNPMRAGGVIGFRLPSPGPVRVQVIDPSGRVVRTLVDARWLEAGDHRVAFDGRDRHGRALPAGMLFYRVQAAAGVVNKRLAFVR